MAEGFTGPLDQYGNVRLDNIGNQIREFYPSPALVDASLPQDAQRYLKQAIETKFAPDASIVMAASSVDAMLKAKGYNEGSLYARIDKAVSDHVLTEGMGKWAHKIRLEANAVRHADDEAAPPTEDEAKQVIVSTAEQNQATGRRKSRPLGGASGERREGVARPEFPACSVGHF